MVVVGATNVGKHRTNNEDSYFIDENKNFFILADGMGGHLAGETASQMATQIISDNLYKFKENPPKSDIIEEIRKSIIDANLEIFNKSKDFEEYRGMGTTLTFAYINNGHVIYANIGDSRLYKIDIEKKEIKQITKDDSYVNYLIEIGEITEDEAKIHPKKNVLTKALGTSPKIDFSIDEMNLEKGEILLLCSDGLTNMVDNKDILRIVKEKEPHKAHEELINEALKNGGIDNVTLILIYNE
ncbi:Stp1/IreP family PP2C-type Ser/Thr phosphatase [Peptoniphilus raoultii]|uniref:Stp1/IreP family PP2C-type Ser/Thr phosphatase n=1 Tax=Peptoniphilus raoultii TaxID=1776387 RepID=UPI0008D92801|nr:Stp1/IreP family PP2C-type Ser/Thr phosphatase [Peptoniphilus raoultii]